MEELESPLPAARPSALQAWIAAARPRTLTIAAVPVLVGAALARTETAQFDPAVTLAALAVAVLIQVGTNMQNDLGDFERGAGRRGSSSGSACCSSPRSCSDSSIRAPAPAAIEETDPRRF
jgi:1,4-dihydroxy-2-naphthoate octaprenyltransferase